MKKMKLETEVEVYEKAEDLPEPLQNLLQKANNALHSAYAPYSKFYVGAAVLLENGEVIGGSNQENAAYPVCICAERVALSAASSIHPNQAVKAIAITAKSQNVEINQPVSPCGTCRQFMSEVEDKHQQKFKVVLQGMKGPVYVLKSVKDLLPFSFDGSFL